MKTAMTVVCAAALIAAIAGAAAQQQARDQEMVQSGFVMRAADTPAKVARMNLLPPLVFVARTRPAGRYYLFADPNVCQCVFVGAQQAMNNYQSQIEPVTQLAPTQAIPPDTQQRWVVVHDVDDDPFGDGGEEDILQYQF